MESKNTYHSVHLSTFSCNTCHSQDYNNCGSCHIGGEGARIASYQGFKIGMNPIPDTKPFKYAVLRRSLMAPDSWQNYGVANLANFNVRPTFKYATPHNIQRWTSRTQVEAGKPCYDACHIIKNSDGSYRNKELYLFKNDLQTWEVIATSPITVDGKLPSKWDVK
jgi:thiosulfate/3-mercaptopyruvate sulfurtransferase